MCVDDGHICLCVCMCAHIWSVREGQGGEVGWVVSGCFYSSGSVIKLRTQQRRRARWQRKVSISAVGGCVCVCVRENITVLECVCVCAPTTLKLSHTSELPSLYAFATIINHYARTPICSREPSLARCIWHTNPNRHRRALRHARTHAGARFACK